MRIRNVTGSTLDLAMPAWRQGRYAILDPAGTVHAVRAASPAGTPLNVTKTDKATWRIRNAATDATLPTEITVTYNVYANSLNDRTRHVDDSHAFLSGATVFMYLPERRTDAVSVLIEAPPEWQVSSGLKHVAGNPRLLLAPDFDTLIDSPIEVGIHDAVCFLVDGKPHDLVVWGTVAADMDRLKRDLAALVRTQAAFWGSLPYDRYVFMLHVAPGLWGGTEHLNSTIMQAAPAAFENDQEYRRLLSLASHELFHAWNVKRLRPAALRHLDLGKENYSDLLWLCEGTTSYYDDLFVVRAGLQPADAFLASVAESIYQVRARPGSLIQSLAESSFDAWVKFNRPTPNDVNTTVSFYEGGALFSLFWDLTLRVLTGNKQSLDAVMRELYRLFPPESAGFSSRDLITITSRLAGRPVEDIFERHVFGTAKLPFEEAFEVVGLRLTPIDSDPRAYLGLSVQDQNGLAVVRSVLADGPAYAAGVNVGDELIAINENGVSPVNFVGDLEARYRPGDALRIQVRRRGQSRFFAVCLDAKPQSRCRLVPVTAPTDKQRAAYQSWLNQPFPESNAG
jgi:predicted metalloprotease with PDZ domain